MNKPLKIGITGGIGAGKSIISKVFNALGIPVYDADSRAKWLMNNDLRIKSKIIDFLGSEAYKKDELNREYIAGETFANPEKLQQLNEIVHPIVGEDYQIWVSNQKCPYSLKEAALIFEAGSYQDLDKIIVVTAPESLRVDRVLERDKHRSKEDVQAIMNRQWPEEKKIANADFLIKNDGIEMIMPQVLSLDQILRKLTGK